MPIFSRPAGNLVCALDPQAVAEVDFGENAIDFVIAVGPAAQDLEAEVQLGGSTQLKS